MPEMQCRLISHSLGGHIQQLYTGFLMLRKRGLIGLSQHCTKQGVATSTQQHLRHAGGGQLRVLINEEIRAHYDEHDAVEINEKNLEQCDFYFKRSFSRKYVDNLSKHKGKVFPLGLSYRVLPDSADPFALQRAFILGKGLRGKLLPLIDALHGGNILTYNPRVRSLEGLPNYRLAPKVLFLTTAYDPYSTPDRSKEKIEEFHQVNETRAKCIQVLRKELGANFLGGFDHNPYATKTYREFLVPDNRVTRKRNYLATLRSYPICIATTGLHGSIGWKLGEYVALSKAVVSEKLNYEVPGGFQEGRNYLEFASPEQCAEKAVRLIEDQDTRNRLMLNNALYYQSNLRPDARVLNTLLKALSNSSGRSSAIPFPRAA